MKKSARKGDDGAAVRNRDDRYRIIAGFTALSVAGYLGLAFIAYLFTWKADQDSVLTYGWGLLFEDVEVANWLGPLGAVTSHTAFFNGFGATSFLLVYLLAITGLAVLKRRPLVKLQRQLRWGLAGLMGLSIMLAFLFQMVDFPVGGAYGYLVASSLESLIGLPGMLLLLALSILVLVVWIFNPSMEELRSGEFFQRIELNPSLAGMGNAFTARFTGKNGSEDADDEAEVATKRRSKRASASGIRSYEGDEEGPENVSLATSISQAISPNAKFVDQLFPIDNSLDDEDDDVVNIELGGPERAAQARRPLANAKDFEMEITYASGDPSVEATEVPDDEDPEFAPVQPMHFKRPGDKPRAILDAEDEHEIQQQGPYDPKLDLRNYRYPEISLLKKYPEPENPVTLEELQENKSQIVDSLMSFGLQITNISATVGPTITLYEIIPAAGQRIAKFRNLSDDIALSLSALGIRIIAPMPGRGSIGVEVPNKNRQMVPLREVLSSER